MERRRLGRLEHRSSVVIYGGAALAEVTQDEADASISYALESGINHFDTAADYGDSELRLGPWMERLGASVFLATKTGERTRDGARRSIEASLERLRVDRVDLLQLHAIGDEAELDAVTARGGALEAAIEARDEGLVGGIGITGHGHGAPSTHLEALRRFPFDTVLTPLNYVLYGREPYRRNYDALAAETTRQDAALLIIKALAKNLWGEGEPAPYTTWYEPLEEQRRIDAAIAFVLARPEVAGLAAAADVRLLPRIVEGERRAETMSGEEIDAVLGGVPEYASTFEPASGRAVPEWLDI
ncbi:MAG TPA: aldo/keto reductase [Actinomycetota bacterium]|nr:aldo/keto reductase [Actinomycetota bacterium]